MRHRRTTDMLLLRVLVILSMNHFSIQPWLPWFTGYPKYDYINRTITTILPEHAKWLQMNCGFRRSDLVSTDSGKGLIDFGFKIYGGDTTQYYQYPWAVGIQIRTSSYKRRRGEREAIITCSGSLISSKHVLSAQSCFINSKEVQIHGKTQRVRYDYNETKYKAIIKVGKGNPRSNLQFETKEKARYVVDHDFYTKPKNDWVLLELEAEVPWNLLESKAIVPICLPRADDVLRKNDYVEAYGQGIYSKPYDYFIMRHGFTQIENPGRFRSVQYENTISTTPDLKTSPGDNGGGITKKILLMPDSKRRPFFANVLVGIPVTVVPDQWNVKRTYSVDVRKITDCITSLTGIQPYSPTPVEK